MIRFKCRLYASVYPSFPRSGSFLDICLTDHQIHIQGKNSSVNCRSRCCSDFCFQKPSQTAILFVRHIFTARLNYKKTNWKLFQKKIFTAMENYDNIPNNVNLSNNEIYLYLKILNNIILKAIEQFVLKFENIDQFHKF